jgi:hypothetical protein
MSRRATTGLVLAAALVTPAPPALAAARSGVWFCGDFESGGLDGWVWDRARRGSIVVVSEPVRKGRFAARFEVAPGDRAAYKERAELKIGDRELERVRGAPGRELWYGWSLFVPDGYPDAPGGEFHIVAQWHHRPEVAAGERSEVAGPPPLALRLVSRAGNRTLILVGRDSPRASTRTLGTRALRRGVWADLVFHIRWSAGGDGFVEGWLDGEPFTGGKQNGPTLYGAVSNYLRLGLYRGQGFATTNQVFYDEVRIGDSYASVAP